MSGVGTPAAKTCSYTIPFWYSMWTATDQSRDFPCAETRAAGIQIITARPAANTHDINIFFKARTVSSLDIVTLLSKRKRKRPTIPASTRVRAE